MQRLAVLLVVAVTAAAITAVPAFGGDTLAQKVRKLTQRTNKTNAKVAKIDDRLRALGRYVLSQKPTAPTVRRISSFARTSGPLNNASASVSCGPGEVVTGGGASFTPALNGDTLTYTRPSSTGQGWEAGGRAPDGVGSALFEVFALCMDP